MDSKQISLRIEKKIEDLFEELRSGISAREDSRAFGAMIEKRIIKRWSKTRAMNTSDSLDKTLKIGAVFTPSEWAEFAVDQFGLFDTWMKGASVFDPTMGSGDLLFALIEYGLKKGHSIHKLPTNRLYGVELNTHFFSTVFEKVQKKYGIHLPKENFLNEDILFQKRNLSFDIIFGNPPWQNFVDLPEKYKLKIRGQFFMYDLIGDAQSLLLGGSRIDIAALIIKKTIQKNLKENGEAIFFIPLSLLLNDGANKLFRKYQVNGVKYNIDKVFDFNELEVFDGIATRYGLIHISRDKQQIFPILYNRWEQGMWSELSAQPIFHHDDPLSVFDGECSSFNLRPIVIQRHSQPRQGINTCGANHVFFFDHCKEIDSSNCEVANKVLTAVLPRQYLYPLITSKNFLEDALTPKKWVLMPHGKNGKPLEYRQVRDNDLLWSYFKKHENSLRNRGGSFIGAWIKKELWWALLGVGEYNFYPYKIVWEAYGKTFLHLRLFLVSGKRISLCKPLCQQLAWGKQLRL